MEFTGICHCEKYVNGGVGSDIRQSTYVENGEAKEGACQGSGSAGQPVVVSCLLGSDDLVLEIAAHLVVGTFARRTVAA